MLQEPITIRQFIRRTWWIVVLTAGAAALAAYIFTASAVPRYRVSARLVVSPDVNLVDDQDLLRSLDTLDRGSVTATYAEILNSTSISESARRQAGISSVVIQDYQVNAFTLPETNVIGLTVTGPDPNTALDLADAIVNEGSVYIKQLYPVFLLSTLDAPERPNRPIGSNPLRNVSVALVLGIVLGGALAVMRSPGIIRALNQQSVNISAVTQD